MYRCESRDHNSGVGGQKKREASRLISQIRLEDRARKPLVVTICVAGLVNLVKLFAENVPVSLDTFTVSSRRWILGER
jgi:hypothetical protein